MDKGFKLYWRWKSKAPVGRPKIDKEIRELIKRMSLENPLWGTPRIQSELRLLGFDLAESTVAKYRVRGGASPSQTWKTFLANHAKQIAAIDFGAVPMLTFRWRFRMDPLSKNLPATICALSKRADLSQADIARLLGIPPIFSTRSQQLGG